MGRLLVLAISLCLLSCVYAPVRAPIGDRAKRPVPPGGYHTVVRGDTLYSIAWQYELDADKIADWNKIGPPYTIYTRQRLRLIPPTAPKPEPPVVRRKPEPPPPPKIAPSRPKIASANRPARPTPSSEPVQVRPSRPKTSAPIAVEPVPEAAAPEVQPVPAKATVRQFHDKLAWTWPAKGGLLRRFDSKSPGKKGISIDGNTGDDVLAAASGKVVYSGSGLSGYGRLIIIKHNQRYLSAYAHNKKLLAKEGDWVEAGQLIAQMGSSGTNRTQLYFEIRENQTSVDPLKILPGR